MGACDATIEKRERKVGVGQTYTRVVGAAAVDLASQSVLVFVDKRSAGQFPPSLAG